MNVQVLRFNTEALTCGGALCSQRLCSSATMRCDEVFIMFHYQQYCTGTKSNFCKMRVCVSQSVFCQGSFVDSMHMHCMTNQTDNWCHKRRQHKIAVSMEI